jgi:DNA polymerase
MHPETGIYTLSYAFNDEPPTTWLPGDPLPERLAAHVTAGGALFAWNATFERLIWWYILSPEHGFPEPALEQFFCTAARCRAHGMPSALGDAGRALGITYGKDVEGKRLIKTYSVFNVPWEQIPEEDQRLWVRYCERDVVTERDVGSCLRELDDYEWAEYHANERVNDRGVPVDLALAAAALEYAEEVRDDVDRKVRELTGGLVPSSNSRKQRDAWLLPQLTEEQTELLAKYKNGVKSLSFDKNHREALALHPTLPEPVHEWLGLMIEAGGATISKYKGMAFREVDGRVPGALLWNGAGQTGRFASRGLQLHNLRRDSLDDPEPTIALLLGGYELPEVTTTLARLVRSAVYDPDGMSWCDWSAIEGRVAPWLAKSKDGKRKLDRFRVHDADPSTPDVYSQTAGDTYSKPADSVTKDERQVGKVQELSLQFLGGIGALKAMARNYGLYLEDAFAETLKDRWRRANPWAKAFGRGLENATFAAIRKPGQWFTAGRVAYAYDGADWLWCRLPSGRLLAYFQPRIELVETPWGAEAEAVTCVWGSGKPKAGEDWPRRAMHGGIWIENTTQAVSADLLREALLACEDDGLEVFLHVHDEIVAGGDVLQKLERIMAEVPPWAPGLPLAATGGTGTRYGK